MTLSPDPFEFITEGDTASSSAVEICIADDIIHNGRLLALNCKYQEFSYRRCESDGKGSGERTAEYRNLRRAVSEPAGAKRHPPPAVKARVRPRWYWLAFRSVRAPAEMGIRDIKSRQKRRNSATEVDAVCGSNGGNGAWRVIRSLSCKGSESAVAVNVTVPLRVVR